MGWLSMLEKTYDNCAPKYAAVGEIRQALSEGKRPLLPLFHTTQTAHLEIFIDGEGNFLKAEVLQGEKGKGVFTVIPCTAEASNRANSISPYPLCDNLGYIVKNLQLKKQEDKEKEDKQKKRKKKEGQEEETFASKHEAYMNQLQGWAKSVFATDKVRAIYNYISKGQIVSDLANAGIVQSEGGFLCESADKVQFPLYKLAGDITKTFVRFSVEIYGLPEYSTYFDDSLYRSWVNYKRTLPSTEKYLCYASGKEQFLPAMHAKYIRNVADGTKLVSTNDRTNFTFRGKFEEPEEACIVGEETSEKAHLALKWLINRQGVSQKTTTVVAWSTQRGDALNPLNSKDFYDEDDNGTEEDTEGLFEEKNQEEIKAFVGQTYAQRLSKMLLGVEQKNIKPDNRIIVMGFNSASTEAKGRLAISYYKEFEFANYLEKLHKWYLSCSWLMLDRLKDGSYVARERTPYPREIISAMYGSECDDRLKSQIYQRLLPCIVEQAPLPYDFVQSSVARTTRRLTVTYKGKYSEMMWQKALSTTCALYKKYYEKENYNKMAVDENRTTRSYLFGRLLAVADETEQYALYKAGDNGRNTAAMRYFSAFAAQPAACWVTIRKSLQVYLDKLGASAFFYKKLIDEITDKFVIDDFNDNSQLFGEYLIGYSNQIQELRTKKEKNKENNIEEEK